MTTSTSSPPPTKPVGPDAVPTPASGAPVEAPASPKRRRGARAGWWLVAFVVACGWDRAVWLMVTRAGRPTLQWLEDSLAWETLLVLLRGALRMRGQAIGEAAAAIGYGALYLYGRMWPWIALALVFIFRHWAGTDGARVKAGLRRGVFVVLVPGAAGLAAEAMKLLTRRMRPEAMDGYYQFRPWPGSGVLSERFWNASGLGLASSHAAVAFGGALAAGVLLPRWRWVLWGSAVLCALGRVAVGAHYLSDVVAGAALAFGAFHLFYAWDRRNNRGVPIGA
ncbi:MAG TPA: phosphatase PAP2 family protein [Phycisphaerales bacterium]|nr:phosphatase PAP2 family protein [Phycisphaerales bacterium]